jgi:hypothetical protein
MMHYIIGLPASYLTGAVNQTNEGAWTWSKEDETDESKGQVKRCTDRRRVMLIDSPNVPTTQVMKKDWREGQRRPR